MSGSEESICRVFAESPIGMYIASNDGFIQHINSAAMTMFGAKRSRVLIGQTFIERIHPASIDVVKQRAHMTLVKRQAVPFLDEHYLRLDGTHFEVEVAAMPIVYERHKSAVVLFHDITSRKQEENKRRAIEQRLLNVVHSVVHSWTGLLQENLPVHLTALRLPATENYSDGSNPSGGRNMRILLVEGEAALASYIRKGLEAESYSVDVAPDFKLGCRMVSDFDYDLVVLDLALPKSNGISALRSTRPLKLNVPVLALTSCTRFEDRVLALDNGADDCLSKPFAYSELSARVRALLRRGLAHVNSVLRVADLELDRTAREVQRAGRKIDLTAKEFALLEYLMRNAGRSVTRSMIVEHCWNLNFDTRTNVVDVYINYLRKKVDEDASCSLIRTVRGVGYALRDDGGKVA